MNKDGWVGGGGGGGSMRSRKEYRLFINFCVCE